TSDARVRAANERPADALQTDVSGLWLTVAPSDHPKCIRCWHHREDVGSNREHPEICGRCVENVAGAGEARQYA
ncbi:MAG: zinc finger domain-containing protein, partial [Acidiferrobacterales bacterium]|nr:zinc finger domain-containing protein [Acidiferrobacterales bacterium]